MNKIKSMFSGMISSVKETLNRFPVTTILVFVITLITTFLVIDTNFTKDVKEMIEHILLISSLTAIGAWLVEALFEERKDLRRIIGYVVALIISIILDRMLKFEVLAEELLARLVIEYVTACFLSTVYILVKRSKEAFEKYILNLLLNIKRASIIYGIVAIGFLILYGIFTVLILDSLSFKVVSKIICMFTGFYYIPVVIKSFNGEEAEDTKFNKAVFSKVLLPLISLAMIIIYIYIVKIFLVTEVPKNELFSILSFIFVCAFPVYVVNKNYSEKGTLIYKINKAIPYLYIPFIFLQIYSMGIRINEYGLTTSRYMACVLIIFEIIAITLACIKESKYLREIIWITLIISAFVTITPFNYKDMPKLSQKAIVDKYVEKGVVFDNLSDSDKRKFAGAYQYIDDNEKYINQKLTQTEKDKLSSYRTYRYSYESSESKENKTVYKSYDKDLNNLDISKYSKIYKLPYSYKSGVMYECKNEDLDISVNLQDYANKLMEANEISTVTAERFFDETLVRVDDNRDIYLTRASISYERANNKIKYIHIEGFVLQK